MSTDAPPIPLPSMRVGPNPQLNKAMQTLADQRHPILSRERANKPRPDDAWALRLIEQALDIMQMAEAVRLNPAMGLMPGEVCSLCNVLRIAEIPGVDPENLRIAIMLTQVKAVGAR